MMQKLASIIFILSGCVVFLLLPLIVLTYLNPYYFEAFQRFHVYENFSGQKYSQQELDIRFTHVLAYLQPDFNTVLESDFFSPEDIDHMHDVQAIFLYIYVIIAVAFGAQIGAAVFLMVRSYRSDSARVLELSEKSVGLILVGVIILGALMLLTWDRSFIVFHQILFPNSTTWMLDPQTSNLIKFLPDVIFRELAGLYIAFLAFEYVTWKISSVVYKRSYT